MSDPKHIQISITPGIVFKTILICLLFYVLYIVRDLVLVVVAAVVIASALEPLTVWLGKYRVKRLPAVIGIYFTVAILLVGIFYLFIPLVINDVSNFLDKAPTYIDNLDVWNPIHSQFFDTSGLQNLAKGFSLKQIVSNTAHLFSNTTEGFFQTISSIFGGILSFILIIVLSFYFAVQEHGIDKFLRIITPIEHESYIVDLWHRSQHKIGRWLQGQLLLGLVIGIFVYLGLTVFGIRNAIVFAILAMVFELIPLFGPILSAIPGVAVAFVDGGTAKGLLILGYYIFIQQFENHLIYPLVVKKIVGVPPILVILALIVGGKLGGFLGILLSVPLAAVLMEYLDDVQRFKSESRNA